MSDAPAREQRPGFESGVRRPRYQIILEGKGGKKDDHKLRAILKRVLRDGQLVCLEVRELP